MPITQPDPTRGPTPTQTPDTRRERPAVAPPRVLNIAGYLFVELSDLDALRLRLFDAATARGLHGTVLLATEGINLFLAGSETQVRDWLTLLRHESGFEQFSVKESWSDTVPFKRLKVKIKREIIRMDHPTIKPAYERAESVAPVELKEWIERGHDDAGRPIVLLDTRNEFEVEHGTFVGATHWNIERFTQFPAQVVAHAAEFVDKRVVSFCTGGIRCEKAALFMRNAGIANVVQLDGGILRYFEDVGQEHFEGACFVFDERVGLKGDLTPVGPR